MLHATWREYRSIHRLYLVDGAIPANLKHAIIGISFSHALLFFYKHSIRVASLNLSPSHANSGRHHLRVWFVFIYLFEIHLVPTIGSAGRITYVRSCNNLRKLTNRARFVCCACSGLGAHCVSLYLRGDLTKRRLLAIGPSILQSINYSAPKS